MRRIIVLTALVTSCALKGNHPTALQPERYILPLVSADAQVCIQQSEHLYSCIRAEDLRKLLSVLGRT